MAITNVNMTGVVVDLISVLHVRNRPSSSGDIVGYLYEDDKIRITLMMEDWCYSPDTGGWCLKTYLELTNNDSRAVNVPKPALVDAATKEAERIKNETLNRQYDTLGENLTVTARMSDQQIADSLIINNLNGVYGIPYQFMESVDPRLGGSTMGAKYSEKIITKMPLLCITPGTAKFMSNYSKENKKGVLNFLMNDGIETALTDIITKNGRYFTFEFAYADYFEYVNSLCQVGARFLNIEKLELNIGGHTDIASRFDWQKALNPKLQNTFASQEFIGFYIDSLDSVSESFTNNTGQSQIANAVNGFSALANELGFLMGAGAGIDYQSLMTDSDISSILDSVDTMTQKYLNKGFLSNLGSNFSTVASGGKLLFPEIWQESEFSRDVDISIKLRTPDCDTVSWYLNIYVPLCHLIALAAGHQTNNPNGYYSPFLIRAFYKGAFNIDMGIVTNLSIKKGREAAWNIDGLPTEIDIDMTIKDLYNMLSIVPATEPKNFVTNNLLMDYVANTCGININQMDIGRSLEIYYVLATERVVNLPNRIFKQLQDGVDNYTLNLYNGALNNFLI